MLSFIAEACGWVGDGGGCGWVMVMVVGERVGDGDDGGGWVCQFVQLAGAPR